MKPCPIAIFPILPKHVDKIFSLDKKVFVKYTNFSKLKAKSRIIFYVSKQGVLIGEATIERVEKCDPKSAWGRYKSEMYLDREEYDLYTSISLITNKPRRTALTIFVLKNVKRYEKPEEWNSPMSPCGIYLKSS